MPWCGRRSWNGFGEDRSQLRRRYQLRRPVGRAKPVGRAGGTGGPPMPRGVFRKGVGCAALSGQHRRRLASSRNSISAKRQAGDGAAADLYVNLPPSMFHVAPDRPSTGAQHQRHREVTQARGHVEPPGFRADGFPGQHVNPRPGAHPPGQNQPCVAPRVRSERQPVLVRRGRGHEPRHDHERRGITPAAGEGEDVPRTAAGRLDGQVLAVREEVRVFPPAVQRPAGKPQLGTAVFFRIKQCAGPETKARPLGAIPTRPTRPGIFSDARNQRVGGCPGRRG